MQRDRTFTWDDPSLIWEKVKTLGGLDCLQRVVSGEFPQPPMAKLMDIRLVEVSKGRAVFASTPGEYHYNPLGTVHGGFAATMLDSAMGCCVHSTLDAGDQYTTLEFKINFLRPLSVTTGEVRGIGTVLYAGRSTALAEAKVEGVDGKIYAHATSTLLIKRA
jgi:uncharacterized protein (TIGR00369 family)